jgi:putative transposase
MMKRKFLPVPLWEQIFKTMDEHRLRTAEVAISLDVSRSTVYRKLKQYKNGGVLPRKTGNGRKRKYSTVEYEPLLRDIIRDFPPVFGHKRIWMEAKRRGTPFGQVTCYRMLKELGLLVVKEKGRCRKKYEPLSIGGPNQVYLVDTTNWPIGNLKTRIYVAMDANSRYSPSIMVFQDKTSRSTVRLYEKTFDGKIAASVHTDNGLEFDNNQADGYLKMMGIMHRYGPSYTPEAQGLIEHFIKTLKTEWLMWKDIKNIWDLQKSLEEFRNWYNKTRTHMALDNKTPEEIHFANNQARSS